MTEIEKKFVTLNRQPLGEILMERHVLTKSQLKQALATQKEKKQFIGNVLMQLGFLREKDLVAGLVIQNNIPYIAIDQYEITPDVLKIIPKEFVVEHRVVPLELVGNILSVVMENPLNPTLRAELEQRFPYKIVPFISTKGEIDNAIARFYNI